MRLPPSVRYLPSRLQILFNPWVWLGFLVTGIVGIYGWEYQRNPGRMPWQLSSTDESTVSDAAAGGVIDSLTPEEQAVAAELDNIELLLNQLESDVSQLTSGGESSAAAALNAAIAEATGTGTEDSESPVERLNQYIDEYSFGGGTTSPQPATVVAPSRQQPAALSAQKQSTSNALTVQPFLASPPAVSPLSTAVSGKQAQPGTAPQSPGNSLEQEETRDGSTSFSFDQTGVIPGSLDGLNRSFIRTTPNMSPPPGTTGYVPPASLPVLPNAPEPPGTNSFASPATTAPSLGNGVPGARSQVLPPVTNSVEPSLEIPAVNGSTAVTPEQPRNAWEAFFD